MGLVTMALVIGHLPTLYGAYSRREVQPDLDDTGRGDHADRVPGGLLRQRGGQAVAAAFTEWEQCDEVFDSHTAYPMLAMFRSRQPGQNWLTALGVVLDAATICLAAVDSAPGGAGGAAVAAGLQDAAEPRGCPRPASAGRADGAATEEAPFREAYERLRGLEVPLHPTSRPGPSSAGCGGPTSPGCRRRPGCCRCRWSSGTRRPGWTSPLRLTSGSPASSARRYQAARASR